MIRHLPLFLGLCLLLSDRNATHAQTLTVSTPMPAPNWALLQREVLEANTQSIEEFCRVYLDERGYLLHTPRNCSLDGPDDAIETFANMTLLPALGASENIYDLFLKAQEGHLRQYKEVTSVTTEIARNSDYHKDFRRQTDWYHQGEGLRGFFFQPLYDPQDAIFQQRIAAYSMGVTVPLSDWLPVRTGWATRWKACSTSFIQVEGKWRTSWRATN